MKISFLPLLISLLLGLTASSHAASKPPVTTIYLVRHAEKDPTAGADDPALTPAGEARARLLAKRLARRHPAALFTTDTRRARATLAPLAQAVGLVPQSYNAQAPDALAVHIYQDYAGKTVVVVGHSNTLLPLLKALGVQTALTEIKDAEYDYLFKVELRPNEPARLSMSHYGAAPVPTPPAAVGRPMGQTH
ncbi:SixA phosphatase family protein [Hymenobacter psoromatis]|uniref:SixA phosphatase family protein n=1 Tax=Hymenobacter psoromatis TaxID=1484116 RepID=UPI001CC078B6|nr:histidine phosphatase family protein [Hymenobacter psoromatis]